jgi:hypothetical protein
MVYININYKWKYVSIEMVPNQPHHWVHQETTSSFFFMGFDGLLCYKQVEDVKLNIEFQYRWSVG